MQRATRRSADCRHVARACAVPGPGRGITHPGQAAPSPGAVSPSASRLPSDPCARLPGWCSPQRRAWRCQRRFPTGRAALPRSAWPVLLGVLPAVRAAVIDFVWRASWPACSNRFMHAPHYQAGAIDAGRIQAGLTGDVAADLQHDQVERAVHRLEKLQHRLARQHLCHRLAQGRQPIGRGHFVQHRLDELLVGASQHGRPGICAGHRQPTEIDRTIETVGHGPTRCFLRQVCRWSR